MNERTVRQAFHELISRRTPTQAERSAAAGHRASVEAALEPLDIFLMRETGSFSHGTAVRGHCDVDLLVSLKGTQPSSPETALKRVREALSERFPTTTIRVSRPAVVIKFGDGSEVLEVIPAYYQRSVGGEAVYQIPAPGGAWMATAPEAHLRYVNRENASPAGGAKALARLIKAWKYCNSRTVKLSSFYLEMRAAQYMAKESVFLPEIDFERLMRSLGQSELAPMNDPTGMTGQIRAASTNDYLEQALTTLRGDAQRTSDALALENSGDRAASFEKLGCVFIGGRFPSRRY